MSREGMSREPEFRRSSFSSGGNCVEVAFERSSFCHGGSCVEVAFRRSSFCGSSACVEVDFATVRPNVLVRDSKSPEQQPFEFTPAEWAAFVAGVKLGEFDLPI